MKVVATIYTDFSEKFGIPRQGALAHESEGIIVFEPEYRMEEALRGIEKYSHLSFYDLYDFDAFINTGEYKWSPTVRPPRLGGNKRVGVFATRSPFRPNPIGLTAVRLIGVEQTKNKGAVLRVAGVDLMNGTPIYDIKPYLPYADSIPEASLGFAGEHLMDVLEVVCSDELWGKIPEDKRGALEEVLSQDPRPAYHEDETRKYGMEFSGFDIIFHVKKKVLYVDEIKKGNLTTKSKLL